MEGAVTLYSPPLVSTSSSSQALVAILLIIASLLALVCWKVHQVRSKSRVAKARWLIAQKRIRRLLFLRKLWASLGHWLQQPEVADLTAPLKRRRSNLASPAKPKQKPSKEAHLRSVVSTVAERHHGPL